MRKHFGNSLVVGALDDSEEEWAKFGNLAE